MDVETNVIEMDTLVGRELSQTLIDTELRAIEAGEYLTYDTIDWQASVYNGILFLHVYAFTYDWEDHHIYYIDTETYEQLSASEMLARLNIDEDYMLDVLRTRAEELFVAHFANIPEEDREEFGYYECLEQTLSDDFVNLDLPIFVSHDGQITVTMKLSTMAGSGILHLPISPFFADSEEAVG